MNIHSTHRIIPNISGELLTFFGLNDLMTEHLINSLLRRVLLILDSGLLLSNDSFATAASRII